MLPTSLSQAMYFLVHLPILAPILLHISQTSHPRPLYKLKNAVLWDNSLCLALPAAKATIAGWIVRMIKFAYHELGKDFPAGHPHAHAMRAVALSWAALASCDIYEMLRTGTWASSSTFVHQLQVEYITQPATGFSSHVLSAATAFVSNFT